MFVNPFADNRVPGVDYDNVREGKSISLLHFNEAIDYWPVFFQGCSAKACREVFPDETGFVSVWIRGTQKLAGAL